jgi:hypothetical protein
MGGSTYQRGKGEWRRFRWGTMIDGLHILIWNRTNKPLRVVLSEVGKVLRGRDSRGDITNIQYKPV